MKKPSMILFDYGQTLVDEERFDGVRGTEAVLKYAIKNKYNKTATEIQAVADEINDELGRFDPKRKHLLQTEVSNRMFDGYLYESQGIVPDHDFEFILATSEYMFRKPNPRIFRLALEKADLQPEEVWYVGDQFECDIVGAQNAGMTPVWYVGACKNSDACKQDGESKGVLTVTSWSELQEIMEEA